MRIPSIRFERSVLALAVLGLVGLYGPGCSDDTGQQSDTGGGGATAGDTGGSTGGMTDGEGGGGDDGTSAACEPRSKYIQVFNPNVFIVFDKSASMEGEPLTQAKSGLDEVADNVADDVRMGMSGFPIESCCCSTEVLLELGEHTPGEIKMAYSGLSAGGGTPTAAALSLVRQGERLVDEDDEFDDRRTKAVVLVTDGEPNDQQICDSPKDVVTQTEKLAEEGILTYVVGYQSEGDPSTLNSIAEAGGTNAPDSSNRFYEASDGQALADALLDITGSSLSCSFRLTPVPPQGTSVNVTLGDEDVPESGYEFDNSSGTVELKNDWCSDVRDKASQGIQLNIDVGCPGCSIAGESCGSDADCCGEATCEGGTCKEPCRSIGEECITASECCSNNCAKSGENELGQCTSG